MVALAQEAPPEGFRPHNSTLTKRQKGAELEGPLDVGALELADDETGPSACLPLTMVISNSSFFT